MFSRFFRRHDHKHSDVHDYIHKVLEKREHGRNRVLLCDSETLNHALEKYADQLADKIKQDFEKPRISPVAAADQKTTVHNYGGNVTFQCYVHTPKSLPEIVDLFVRAKEENLKIRAVGAFHSWSPICETDGFLIRTTHLTGVKPTDTTYLKDPAAVTTYYDVLSGMPLNDLAGELEKYGRGLRNMGGCPDLHMVGISCTGAHGSGITLPPLADMIRGVTLVSADFKGSNGVPTVYRIEPTNGMTDPNKPIPNVTLVQDDATFNAITVGLGAFGVVYSITIETVPFYWIKQTREILEWSTVKKQLQQGPNGNLLKYHTCEILMNAYTSRALVTKRELVTEQPAHVTNPNSNPFVALIQAIPAFKKIWKLISKPDGLLDDLHRDLGILLAILLKHLPLLVPTVINIGLDTQNHDEPVVGKYYDVYDIGYASRFPVICCEISYPMNTYIAGVDAALSAVQKDRQKDIVRAIAGFLALRFTSSSSATISMSYSDDPSPAGARSYLEIYSLTEFYNGLQTYDDIVKPIQEQAVSKFVARHHWGQYMASGFKTEQYRKKDPKFAANIAAVRKIADKYDPTHMMSNTFLEKVVFTT